MSLPIWTPAALRSEAAARAGRGWRLVEAQHRVSTMKLVDTLVAEYEVTREVCAAEVGAFLDGLRQRRLLHDVP